MKRNEISSNIGLNLKIFFDKENITQEVLAKKLNTRQSWISRIYNGEFGVRSRIAREMCEMANIPFLDNTEVNTLLKNEKKILTIQKALLSMSEYNRKNINDISSLLKIIND